MKSYSKKWLSLLYELGKEIRKRGVERHKNHGSYWRLVLPNGIIFDHDDYNHNVIVTFPDGSELWWAGNFGGEVGNATEYDLQIAIDAITLTRYPENHEYITSLKEKRTLLAAEYSRQLERLTEIDRKLSKLDELLDKELQ